MIGETTENGNTAHITVNNRYEIGSGKLLRHLILTKHRSIQDFADSVGYSRSRISQIIHGHIEADNNLKIKIAKVLEVDSRYIWPDKKNE